MTLHFSIDFKRTLLAAVIAVAVACGVGVAHAQDVAPLNYDSQALAIFQAAAGRGGPVRVQPAKGGLDAQQKAALNQIYEKLKDHQMFLKNVVWRPDLKVIRLTWADNDDSLVFKIVYRVSHDPVLTNSIYADKNQIIDVKIMFLQDGRYRYLHLDHMNGGSAKIIDGKVTYVARADDGHSVKSGPTPYGVYTLNGHLSAAQCKFCHMLVPGVNGRPGGIFFPRYQESALSADYKGAGAIRTPLFFRMADFQPIHPAQSPVRLPSGLPDPILFQRVGMPPEGAPGYALYSMFARTMFETPELVEAWARDNHQSVCISVDFGPASVLFGRDNYVCADNQNKILYVRLRNAMLSSAKNGVVDYARPYYKDH